MTDSAGPLQSRRDTAGESPLPRRGVPVTTPARSAVCGCERRHPGRFSAQMDRRKDRGRCYYPARIPNQGPSSCSYERLVYSHLGWRKCEGKWCYFHAGSVVSGPDAVKPDVQLEGGGVDSYVLPRPPGLVKLRSAIKASLSILGVAPDHMAYALLAATYRAPLSEAVSIDFSLFVVGPSGSQKSELTALAQAHFGIGFSRLNLPANWTGTANAREKKAFIAKDAILTIDDFAPVGTPMDVQQLHGKADRVLRGQGNHGGRSRMTARLDLIPEYHAR